MRLRTPTGRFSSLIPILLIAAIAGSLAVASYEYSNSVSEGIQNSSIASANTAAEVEVSEMSHILVNQLLAVGKNLQVLSVSESVLTDNVTSATPLFINAQNTTSELTSDYSWIAANGDLMIARNSTGEVSAPAGVNLTSRPFFVAVKESGTPYFGDVILSLQLVPEIVIAWPIFGQTGVGGGQTARTFEGIVAASIEVNSMGNFLKSQLPTSFTSQIGAIDPQGDLLYTGNQTLLGLSIFGPQFQSILPASFALSFDTFLHLSLGGGSGIYDLSYQGTQASIAYQAVLINATSSQTKPIFFAVLYVTTVDVLAAAQVAAVNDLRLFSAASAILIGISGVVASLVVLNWNRRLDRIIKVRTADLVSANKELAEQSQAQKDLINIAAHELRTPAQSILASSELLKDSLNPSSTSTPGVPAKVLTGRTDAAPMSPPSMSDDEVRDLVDSTFRNAQRLQKLTSNLLEVARIDTKTTRLELETFELNEKIRSVIDDFEKLRNVEGKNGKDVRIEFQPKESVLSVRADKIKAFEIVSNLLANAIRHSNTGGRIVVSSEKADGFALVKITDEGSGIDKALMPRLFEKFATNSGTGLGLYISKSYIEAQGGKIWAENNDAKGGAGATFSFTLPLAD